MNEYTYTVSDEILERFHIPKHPKEYVEFLTLPQDLIVDETFWSTGYVDSEIHAHNQAIMRDRERAWKQYISQFPTDYKDDVAFCNAVIAEQKALGLYEGQKKGRDEDYVRVLAMCTPLSEDGMYQPDFENMGG